MTAYFIMFLISEFFAVAMLKIKFIGRPDEKGKIQTQTSVILKNAVFFLTALPFFVIAALRYNLGTDYIVYKHLQIPEVMRGINDRVEFMYRIIIKIGMAMGDAQWVFIITHFLIILFIWLAMRESDDLCMSIFVFMFSSSFNISLNIMRQYICIAICVYATKYIYEKKIVPYYALVAIGTLFHTTGVIFLLFYPLSRIKLKPMLPPVISLVCFAAASVARMALSFLTRILENYAHYMDNDKYDKNDTQYDLVLVEFVILAIGCFVDYLYKDPITDNKLLKKLKLPKKTYIPVISDAMQEDLKFRTYTLIQTFASVFACLSGIIPNSTRIILIPVIGQIIYVPMVLKRAKKISKDLYIVITALYILAYFAIFWRMIINKNMGETNEYHSILSLL